MGLLLFGTANPAGFGDASYDGIYLTDKDMNDMLPTMPGTKVLIEHKGESIGQVVSAWRHNGRMDLLLEIDGSANIEGALAQEFVKKGYVRDLSLGYKVEMSASAGGKLKASNKRVVEVSIVKTGARHDCHIRGIGNGNHRIIV